MNTVENDSLRGKVRESYALIAVSDAEENCCAQSSCCGYSAADVAGVPEGSNMGLGCGNPRAIASLKTGETVLDLGSGGGFDCFLAVKEVGASGNVIGVDMTPEMISKARRNAESAGYGNIEFRLGEIENLPVSDASVNVAISNCVINLSPSKGRVMEEMFRVLKPGGRIAISDVLATSDLPEAALNDLSLFSGCVSGATVIDEYERILKAAGFVDISILPKDESREFIREWSPEYNIEEFVVSASIEAVKPAKS